jgi:hypothetical protein
MVIYRGFTRAYGVVTLLRCHEGNVMYRHSLPVATAGAVVKRHGLPTVLISDRWTA